MPKHDQATLRKISYAIILTVSMLGAFFYISSSRAASTNPNATVPTDASTSILQTRTPKTQVIISEGTETGNIGGSLNNRYWPASCGSNAMLNTATQNVSGTKTAMWYAYSFYDSGPSTGDWCGWGTPCTLAVTYVGDWLRSPASYDIRCKPINPNIGWQ